LGKFQEALDKFLVMQNDFTNDSIVEFHIKKCRELTDENIKKTKKPA
jgi:hypothetical protein